MLARGPELTMELFTPQSKEKESTVVRLRALKGKKHVFRDDIPINDLYVTKTNEILSREFLFKHGLVSH